MGKYVLTIGTIYLKEGRGERERESTDNFLCFLFCFIPGPDTALHFPQRVERLVLLRCGLTDIKIIEKERDVEEGLWAERDSGDVGL